MNDEPLLRLNQLSLAIHGAPILKSISLEVAAGRTLGIIGESGSGKSMTALSIMQLLPRGASVSGDIRFNGQDLIGMDESSLCDLRGRDIGMVFQEPMTALNPVKSIGEQVSESVRLHRRVGQSEASRIAAETLQRVGLPNDEFPLSRYPHELSGGQRQRVVIAIAVACQPRLLIADEPTTALDVTTQAGILDLLDDLKASDGMALILITHDLAVVADRADDVAIMQKGVLVEAGPRQQIFTQPEHPYTHQLFEASAHVPARNRQVDQTSQALLSVEGLCCDYPLPRRSLFQSPGRFRAVNEVSFDIRSGESIGLVGESGCGKSTLTRALLGLSRPSSGRIRLSGTVIDGGVSQARTLRRQMQVVFQDPYGSFNPRHRVARLVAEPLYLLDDAPRGRERLARVVETLESVGMQASDTQRYIHEFSGGQRQRIAIARALIIRPALIILDEAVSALDVSVRAQVLDLLASLADELGLAYLFISHDLSVVRSITDRVLVMQQGVIVEQGETEAIFQNPQERYTKELLAAAPLLQPWRKAQ